MRVRALGISLPLLVLVGVLNGAEAAPAAKSPPRPMSWQEASATLTQVRTKAEGCAAIVKARGEAGLVARVALDYEAARSEMEGVISALMNANTNDERPEVVLSAHVANSNASVEKVCLAAKSVSSPDAGAKGFWAEVVGATIGPVLNAGLELWREYRRGNEMRRETIKTQLESARWKDFSAVSPASY